MNKLPFQTRLDILHMLCEDSSMRAISRVKDVSFNTVSKLLIDAGMACEAFHDKTVRNVTTKIGRLNRALTFDRFLDSGYRHPLSFAL